MTFSGDSSAAGAFHVAGMMIAVAVASVANANLLRPTVRVFTVVGVSDRRER